MSDLNSKENSPSETISDPISDKSLEALSGITPAQPLLDASSDLGPDQESLDISPDLESTQESSDVSPDLESTQESSDVSPDLESVPASLDASSELEPTQAVMEEEMVSSPGRRLPLWLVILIALLMLLIIAAISAYGGFQSGKEQRLSAESTQAVKAVKTQFALALRDIEAGNYGLSGTRMAWFREVPPKSRVLAGDIEAELAVQYELAMRDIQAKDYPRAKARLEWVLEWQADYPGAIDALTEVIFQSQITPTPTQLPTPTLVPTEDIRTQEKLYADAQQSLAAGEWSTAIETMLTLRKLDASFEAVKLDGMLYMAYRNRGVDKILGNSKTDTTIEGVDLQGGSYDLTLAEQFGTLDQEAEAWRRRAKWYLTGTSYWGVDWSKVISNFELLFVEAPYLSDGTVYARDRYFEGLMKYGDWLAQKGEWCTAQEQYQKALDNGYEPPAEQSVEPTVTYLGEQCGGDAPPPEATPTSEGE